MDQRYAGSHMTLYGSLLPGAAGIAQRQAPYMRLSAAARHRMEILDWHRSTGQSPALTARHFGISRKTIYRWIDRWDTHGVRGLVDQSRRPKTMRRPTTSWEIVARVVALRHQYPTWSKVKLAVLIHHEGCAVSPSTVGRILRRKGLIHPRLARMRRRAALHPRRRYPRDLIISQPGDLIQIDTKHLRGIGGIRLYQWTAIDVLTKLRVLRVTTRCSSAAGARFLADCRQSFPEPIRAIQTDNGSEFRKHFDRACTTFAIPHYRIDPKSPKQNSFVERSHRTDDDEFYQQGKMRSTVERLQPLLAAWEDTYNRIRPHHALNLLTPWQYYEHWQTKTLPTRAVIALQH